MVALTPRRVGTLLAVLAAGLVVAVRSPPAAPRPATSMSVRRLAGQRVVFSYAGLVPPRALLAAVAAGGVGGVIFFASNIAGVAQLRGVVDRLQRASLASPLHDRLLMLTDQEGGPVRRLPGGPLLSERQIGASGRASGAAATAAGYAAARQLRDAGVDVNLAPVLDVFRRPGNFIDRYGRSYSGDPALAGALAASFISAQQRLGVAATAKHFPGLGAAASGQNTDLQRVSLPLSLGALRGVDEAPYRRAIGAGVRLVMSSWATYPALDPARPAGMSPAILGGELRGRLRFDGVTITDAIGADALRTDGSLGNRGVLAARAGQDLILCSEPNPADNSVAKDLGVVNALAGALSSGRLPVAAARASVARILALRALLR